MKNNTLLQSVFDNSAILINFSLIDDIWESIDTNMKKFLSSKMHRLIDGTVRDCVDFSVYSAINDGVENKLWAVIH